MGPKRKEKKKGDKPAFDASALAQLTSKIDKSLADAEKQPPTKRKRQRETDEDRDSKRRQTQPSDNAVKTGAEEKKPKNNQASALLDEILALGGDENDLELVANVDSGDEGGGAPRPKPSSSETTLDKSLRDELAQFASTLGFTKFHDEEDPETDEESDAAEEDAEDDAEDVSGDSAEEDAESEEEVREPTPPPPPETRKGKQSGKLVFEPRPDWHQYPVDGLSTQVPENIKHSVSIANLKAYAETLLESDSSAYLSQRASSSTQKFMSTIMSSGTLSDKVSALTLSIQESPLHNRKAFESLITLAGKRSRGQAIAALGALVDLLGNGTVLPDNRRLHPFNAQPALLAALSKQGRTPWTDKQSLPGKLTKPHLMMWLYEDWLKSSYFRIIQLLEVWCSDEIEYSRSRALDFVFGLLKSKPEQEANLLRLVVNKLGDRERKIASRASYLILQMLTLHPGMKAVVINTVEQEVLLKPGQNLRTKYTAVNTLNQTILSTKEPAVAEALLRIYFDIFLSLLKTGSLGDFEPAAEGEKKGGNPRKRFKKKGPAGAAAPANEQETAQKLVSSLLTGVNRAIPFANAEDSTLEKHLDTLFRITHSSNFNTSIQALMLIQQLSTSKQLAVDRFYRTLYESLLDPRLITSSKHALYLNLLFRAMKNDVDVRRVKAFVKRLIQVLSLHQPSFACGILFLIAELQTTFPDLRTMLYEAEDNDDDGEEVYRDVRDDGMQVDTPAQATSETASRQTTTYDGRKRNPEHSNAHRSCLWELMPFLSHYHPSVSVFAGNLLVRQKALPKPDLANHTLMHFLDKFVYRNPKAEESKRGGSIMQPILGSGSSSHIVASNKAATKKQQMVNSSSFWNLKADQVSAEDVFFHEYFARVGKPSEASRAAKKAAAEEMEEAGSDVEAAGEDEIWDALVNSKPDIEGADGEEDSDMDMDEFDYSDDDMEEGGAGLDEKMSDIESEGSGGFEGIFDDESDASAEVDYDEEEEEEEEEEDETAVKTGKELPKRDSRGRLNRKEMKSLPTFASADDYAAMLAAEDDLDD